MSLITVQISNHPLFTEIKRFVDVDSFQVVDSTKQITVYFKMRYIDSTDNDVTNQFPVKPYPLSGNNSTKSILRDDKFQPIPNPEYDEKNPESDKYLTMPTYDYFRALLAKHIAIEELLTFYVKASDEDKFFN